MKIFKMWYTLVWSAHPPRVLKMTSIYTQIRGRVSIVDIISRYLKLRKKGTTYSALCPFHKERTPSFTVQESKGQYHCFGCGAHGDAIDFVKAIEHLSTIEAVKKIADQAGIPFEPNAWQHDEGQQEEREVLLHCLEDVTQIFRAALLNNKRALAYLKGRGISEACQAAFHLGWSDKTVMHMVRQRYSLDTLIKVGLVTKETQRNFFEERIMFPIFNVRKHVIGFGARSLDDARTPKYLNSPETCLFVKHETLYGIEHLKADQPCLIVEGYLDVLACWGHANAVSCLGTALSTEHLKHVWKLTSETIVCFDGDAAGQRATYKALCTALPILEHGKLLRVACMPQGQDPQSVIHYQGWPAMASMTTQALPLFESLYAKIFSEEVFRIPEKRAQAVRSWREHIELIREPDIRYAYQAMFKERFYTKKKHAQSPIVQPLHVSSVLGIELLLGAVCQFPQLALEVEESLSQLHCPQAYQTLHQEIVQWIMTSSHMQSQDPSNAEGIQHPYALELLERIRPHLTSWETLNIQDLREEWIEMFNIYQTQYYLQEIRDTLKDDAHVMFSQWEELKLLTC